MKQYFLGLLLVITSTCFSQKNFNFYDEHGKIQTLIVNDHFQSLSFEVIQEVQKIKPTLGEFIHLATDRSRFYFLTDVSQLEESKKNELYKLLFKSGFSFQVGHGLPEGYVWVTSQKNDLPAEGSLQKITHLFNQIN